MSRDFVVLHEDLGVILKCHKLISEWLAELGLELSEGKTEIRHTLEGNNPGFDFLGFNIRQHKAGIHFLRTDWRNREQTHRT